LIADAAARLFAERGYEQVAVSDVARAAEVSEQTVYNYFQTKEQLVTDLHGHFEDKLDRNTFAKAISDSTPVSPPIAKLHGIALAGVFQIIIDEAGQRTREGQTQDQIAHELHPAIETVLDELCARQKRAALTAPGLPSWTRQWRRTCVGRPRGHRQSTTALPSTQAHRRTR